MAGIRQLLVGTGAGKDGKLPLLLGAVYVVAHLGFVLATPILVIAAGIFAVLLRITSNRQTQPGLMKRGTGTATNSGCALA